MINNKTLETIEPVSLVPKVPGSMEMTTAIPFLMINKIENKKIVLKWSSHIKFGDTKTYLFFSTTKEWRVVLLINFLTWINCATNYTKNVKMEKVS